LTEIGSSAEKRERKKEREKKRGQGEQVSFKTIPSEFCKNSGRKKNSGISSFTSVVESELVSRHVVCIEWNVRSGRSKLSSANKYNITSTTGPISYAFLQHQ
jgi:ribosomal protein S20